MPQITIEQRLKEFNLSAATVKPANLEVGENKTVVLDANDPKIHAHVAFLEPKSIDDIKRWIGIPDHAFAHAPAAPAVPNVVLHRTVRPLASFHPGIVIPPQEHFSPHQVATLQTLARDYIFGHSAAVSPAQTPALNKWVLVQKIKLPIFIFNDIHVAAGAVLNIKGKILFANHITIDKGGVVKMGTHSAIHAAGIKGAAVIKH